MLALHGLRRQTPLCCDEVARRKIGRPRFDADREQWSADPHFVLRHLVQAEQDHRADREAEVRASAGSRAFRQFRGGGRLAPCPEPETRPIRAELQGPACGVVWSSASYGLRVDTALPGLAWIALTHLGTGT